MIVFCFSCVAHMLRSFTGNTPFTTDSKGFTLLHYAACNGHRLAVQMVKAEREIEGDGVYVHVFIYVLFHTIGFYINT